MAKDERDETKMLNVLISEVSYFICFIKKFYLNFNLHNCGIINNEAFMARNDFFFHPVRIKLFVCSKLLIRHPATAPNSLVGI